jgi:hypothetical protein
MNLESFLDKLSGVASAGKGHVALCPAHADHRRSLSVSASSTGKLLLKCHTGCTLESILKALGLTPQDLFNGAGKTSGLPAEYIYRDERGDILYRIRRTPTKQFIAEHYKDGGYVSGMGGVRRVPYNLPALLKAKTAMIVEGEKDVDTLTMHKIIAVTNPFGAGKWDAAFNNYFRGKTVHCIGDNDAPGRKHMLDVATNLLPIAKRVKVIILPGLPDKGDVTDFLTTHTKQELLSIIKTTKPFSLDDYPSEPTVWDKAISAPTFLAEVDSEITGLAKDLIVPGAITLMAAPRGLGKSLVALSVGVTIATGGEFRGEKVNPLRVFLLDRDNPRSTVKTRLRSFGAAQAENLKVLTRENAPDLRDKKAWESFPVSQYDVILIDSLGSFTEGVSEKEGKETTLILATILDLIRRGPAVLLLANCTKDALNLKGRGEWADRIDVVYEVRDATAFAPSGKKDWWFELPAAGESAWADRASRRKKRTDYRLAFVPSKFRLGVQPDPFCLELRLPIDGPWSLVDVTESLIETGERVIKQAAEQKATNEKTAIEALVEMVVTRFSKNDPILKTEAQTYLHDHHDIPRDRGRELINVNVGVLWQVVEGTGKGPPKVLVPIQSDTSREDGPTEEKSSADRTGSGPQRTDTCKSYKYNTFFDLDPPSRTLLTGLTERFKSIAATDLEFFCPLGHVPKLHAVGVYDFCSNEYSAHLRESLPKVLPGLGHDNLLLAYSGSSDLSALLESGYSLPNHFIDPCVEAKLADNNTGAEDRKGLPKLADACTKFGITHGTDERVKGKLAAFYGKTAELNSEQTAEMLAYLKTDVEALAHLFVKLFPTMDINAALERGRYSLANSLIEHHGIPIDTKTLDKIIRNRERIQADIIAASPVGPEIYVGTSYNHEKFGKWLKKNKIRNWPKSNNRFNRTEEIIKACAASHPLLKAYHDLYFALKDFKDVTLGVGLDGRIHNSNLPFGTISGRNKPTGGFIFALSTWWRWLVQAPKDHAIIHLDFSAMEFGVAAYASHDQNMIRAYESGDIHQANADNLGVSRSEAKSFTFSTAYGGGPEMFSRKSGIAIEKVRAMFKAHEVCYPRFYKWKAEILDTFKSDGVYKLPGDGWHLKASNNLATDYHEQRTAANFAVQGLSATIQRRTIVEFTKLKLKIIASQHDSVTLEAPLDAVSKQKQLALEVTRDVSASFLGSPLRADVAIYKDRFEESKGADDWRRVSKLLKTYK